MLQSAISFEFVQVYENAKNITEEILLEINDFPLNELRGFRNKIVHDYGEVDYTIIYRTAKDDVPVLLEKMKQCEYR